MHFSRRKSKPITEGQKVAIRENIFHAAHGAIADWDIFRWHLTDDGEPDAHLPRSSQAFCISVWGTFASALGRAVRQAVASLLQDGCLKRALEQYEAELPIKLESDSRELLNEYGGTQSHLDGVLSLNALSVVIESKLTERLGTCSQVREKHCSGVYGPGSDLKLQRTDFPCRLQYRDRGRTPRLYWEIMAPISKEGAYPIGKACPFAGSGYQVMRNIAAAARMAGDSEWRVIFAYPKSYDLTTGEAIGRVTDKLADEHQRRILLLDYVKLAKELMGSADTIANGLGTHMGVRLGIISGCH